MRGKSVLRVFFDEIDFALKRLKRKWQRRKRGFIPPLTEIIGLIKLLSNPWTVVFRCAEV